MNKQSFLAKTGRRTYHYTKEGVPVMQQGRKRSLPVILTEYTHVNKGKVYKK